jgi:RHS repeat-associated protein
LLINPQGYRTSWTHDAGDRVKVQYLGNSTRASYSYDDANRILKLANIRTDATTISSFDYAYDSVGNRTRVIESDGIRVTWSYDAKYQLTRERRSGANAYDITYSYDSAGNRRVNLEDSIRTTYAYDSANQLRYHEDNTGRTTYTFDANGNQRIVESPSVALTTNTWDFENKLTKVILPSGTRNTFAYDADGKRVKKDDSSGTSKFVWDAENILVETNASDVIQAVYSQEPVVYGNLISQYRSATTSFFHFDGLGSTDQLTNGVGTVTDRYVYMAFGIIVANTGSTVTAFKFVGRQGYVRDSDLDQMLVRARHYSPTLGRFISPDPEPISFVPTLYEYVRNSPALLGDPSGEQPPPVHGVMDCRDPCRDYIRREGAPTDDEGNPLRGFVVCCDGKKFSCLTKPRGPFTRFLDQCILLHELTHHADVDCPCKGLTRPDFRDREQEPKEECEAYTAHLLCLIATVMSRPCEGLRSQRAYEICVRAMAEEIERVALNMKAWCSRATTPRKEE